MTERDYQELFLLLQHDIGLATECYHTEEAMNAYALERSAIYSSLNRHAEFWNLHREALRCTFLMSLGRLFDNDGDSQSLHTLLAATLEHPELFSREALGARKQALVHGTPDWLEEYLAEAWVPNGAVDLRPLKKGLGPYAVTYRAVYAEHRHRVAHNLPNDRNAAIPAVTKDDVEALLLFLNGLIASISNLLLNGHEPVLGAFTFGYKERITKNVRRLMDSLTPQ